MKIFMETSKLTLSPEHTPPWQRERLLRWRGAIFCNEDRNLQVNFIIPQSNILLQHYRLSHASTFPVKTSSPGINFRPLYHISAYITLYIPPSNPISSSTAMCMHRCITLCGPLRPSPPTLPPSPTPYWTVEGYAVQLVITRPATTGVVGPAGSWSCQSTGLRTPSPLRCRQQDKRQMQAPTFFNLSWINFYSSLFLILGSLGFCLSSASPSLLGFPSHGHYLFVDLHYSNLSTILPVSRQQ